MILESGLRDILFATCTPHLPIPIYLLHFILLRGPTCLCSPDDINKIGFQLPFLITDLLLDPLFNRSLDTFRSFLLYLVVFITLCPCCDSRLPEFPSPPPRPHIFQALTARLNVFSSSLMDLSPFA